MKSIVEIQDENNLFKLLNVSKSELTKQLSNEKSDNNILSKYSLINYAKVKLCQQFVKNTLNAINFVVVARLKGDQHEGLTKDKDEYTFYKMVEDFCKLSFIDKTAHPMLLVLKSLMHKNFMNIKY